MTTEKPKQPEPGETMHRVVTDCPDVWRELDDEDKASWAASEAEVVAGARYLRGHHLYAGEPLQAARIDLIRLKQLRGKMCTYGGMINFHDCEHVKRHMAELQKTAETP